jgi:transcriptional regulator GlxA family with amidase domain
MTVSRRPRIALLAARETSASVLYGLHDVLLSVGPTWPDMTTAESGETLLDVLIVSADGTPFRCYGNVLVEPHASLADAGEVDAVVVCDMYTPIDTPPRNRYVVESEWLRAVHGGDTLVAAVCSGSVMLAEAGLLDGRSCAAHWAYADLFLTAYPKVRFIPGAILDVSSERDGLVTAGGVTSWQDLALYLIARLCGPEHAARTARVYLLLGHEDGQLPYSAMTRRVRVNDAAIREALTWIGEHYVSENPVSGMAERSGLSRRTFARRFVTATGRRPIDYVHALRIESARERLESGASAPGDVGFEVGYEDPTFFRRLFKRTTGLTPAAYRRKYALVHARWPTAHASERTTPPLSAG